MGKRVADPFPIHVLPALLVVVMERIFFQHSMKPYPIAVV